MVSPPPRTSRTAEFQAPAMPPPPLRGRRGARTTETVHQSAPTRRKATRTKEARELSSSSTRAKPQPRLHEHEHEQRKASRQHRTAASTAVVGTAVQVQPPRSTQTLPRTTRGRRCYVRIGRKEDHAFTSSYSTMPVAEAARRRCRAPARSGAGTRVA